jgi:hypothetical protein
MARKKNKKSPMNVRPALKTTVQASSVMAPTVLMATPRPATVISPKRRLGLVATVSHVAARAMPVMQLKAKGPKFLQGLKPSKKKMTKVWVFLFMLGTVFGGGYYFYQQDPNFRNLRKHLPSGFSMSHNEVASVASKPQVATSAPQRRVSGNHVARPTKRAAAQKTVSKAATKAANKRFSKLSQRQKEKIWQERLAKLRRDSQVKASSRRD